MIANLAKRRFNWPTQLYVNGVMKTMIAMIVMTIMFNPRPKNPICFVRNILADVLCVMSVDVPTG